MAIGTSEVKLEQVGDGSGRHPGGRPLLGSPESIVVVDEPDPGLPFRSAPERR
jgi:hypothetical protein